MRERCNPAGRPVDAWVESLIVLAVLGVRNGRAHDRLYRSLRDIDPARIDAATKRLCDAGIVQLRGRTVIQTAALDRLDCLDMICV